MISGYYLGTFGYWLPFSIDVAMFSIIFMYAGYVLKKYDLLEKLLKDYRILVVIAIIWIIGIRYSSIELAIRSYPRADLSIITAICGTIVIFKISKIINLKFKKISKILQWYGRNSMIVLGIHHLESYALNGLYSLISNKIINKHIYRIIIASIKVLIATLGLLLFNYFKALCNTLKKSIMDK